MAVAILDNGSGSGLLGAHVGAGSYTLTKAVSAALKRCMVVGVMKAGVANIGAGNYGGQTLSPVAVGTGVSPAVRVYSILEAGIAAASNTTISIATDDDTDDFLICAITFSGVESVTTAGTPTMNDGTSPGSISITGLGAGDYAVGFTNNSDTTAVTSAGTETNGYRNNVTWANILVSLAGASGVLTWTYSGTELALGQGLGLVASAGGGASTLRMNSRRLLGVGR